MRDRVVDALLELGYEVRRPEGTFYLFPKSPIADDRAFTQLLADERVLVLPGAFDTDITKPWGPEGRARAGEINPMKRIGMPQDMVGVCVFLASEASAYVNGAQILVDGGLFRSL